MTEKVQNTAIITGGGTGLGRALATVLSDQGYQVGLLARNDESLREVCQQIRDRNGQACYRTCDVSNLDGVQKAVDQLVIELGSRVDLMIINAGMIGYVKKNRFPSEKIQQILKTNIMGSINTLHAVVPQMLEQGSGHVVGISSLGAFQQRPVGGLRYYYTSKRCMTVILETYRAHLKSHGILVSTMHPGWIDTAMFKANEVGAKTGSFDTPNSAALKIAEAIHKRKNLIFPKRLFLKIQYQNFLKLGRAAIHKLF